MTTAETYRSTIETYDADLEIVTALALASDLLAWVDDEDEYDEYERDAGLTRARAEGIGDLLNNAWEEGVTLDEWLARAVANARA